MKRLLIRSHITSLYTFPHSVQMALNFAVFEYKAALSWVRDWMAQFHGRVKSLCLRKSSVLLPGCSR